MAYKVRFRSSKKHGYLGRFDTKKKAEKHAKAYGESVLDLKEQHPKEYKRRIGKNVRIDVVKD